MRAPALFLLAPLWLARPAAAETNLTPAGPDFKVVSIDSDPRESFFALQLDSAGRLFAGAREGLFVYEPAPGGLYQPRQLLLRFPADSWIGDIAIRGHDLYVATHTAIYRIEGAVTRREGLQPTRLLWGLPALASFEEHQGFHGLVIGPDGDLYVSFGDNQVAYGDFKRADHWGHWTFFHGGGQTPFTGSGGVLRLSPDGRQLDVLARGLRNPCGLAFDNEWNLFTNDNDHESLARDYVPGRLLHVTPGVDFTWPRGWLPEKAPWRDDIPDSLHPALGRYVPSAQAWLDEPFLPDTLRRSLLVAEWGRGIVLRYPPRDHGAGFAADEHPLLTGRNKARPVGLAVGRGGRLFVSALHMAANEASPIARSDIVMLTRAGDPAHAPFEPYDETTASPERLRAESAHTSWHRRYRAHVELLRRIRDTAAPAPAGDELTNNDAWAVAASGQSERLAPRLASPDPTTRLQAVRALARFSRNPGDESIFTAALADAHPRVAHAALSALLARGPACPVDAVLAHARGSDRALRLAAVQLLAARAPLDRLLALADAPNPADRRAAVLALGLRLTLPPVTGPLPEDCPLDPSPYNPSTRYFGEAVDLRTLGRIGAFTMAGWWAVKTRAPDEDRMFDALARRLADADADTARLAAFHLRMLADPRTDEDAARALQIKDAPVVRAIEGAVAATATELPADYRGLDWPAEAAAGDPVRGEKLYRERGCFVCHAILPSDTGGGGPSLAGAGARFSAEYLAESVLVPNKVVAPAFRWTVLTLDGEPGAAGLIVSETATQIELMMVSGVRRVLDKARVTAREVQDRTAMPEGLIQSPTEMRDLLAFLSSLRQSP